jgi:EmrB/QacA subfamily drug resistance transporter
MREFAVSTVSLTTSIKPVAQTTQRTFPALVLPVICVAQLMVTVDVTIVNMALPAIQRQFGMSNAGLAWVIDAFSLAMGGLLLVGGRLGDLIGRRRTLTIGITIFTASSLIGGFAPNGATLLAARAGQGIGAALASPTTLAMISKLYRPGPSRDRALVGYGAMAGLGIALGLVFGGVFTELASWRWVMWVNAPIGVGLLIAAPRVLPESTGLRHKLDIVGVLLGTAGTTTLVYGVVRAGSDGWDDRIAVSALAIAAMLLITFGFQQHRVALPMLPLVLFRHRARFGSYLIAALLFGNIYAVFFFLTRYMQFVLNWGGIRAGLTMLPVGVGTLAFALAARRVVGKTGPRPLVVAGAGIEAVAAWSLVHLQTHGSATTLLLCAAVGLGAGIGTSFVANTTSAVTEVTDSNFGVASGLLSTFQQIGGSIGVAALGAIAASITTHHLQSGPPPTTIPARIAATHESLVAGFQAGYWIAGGMAALAAILALTTAAGRSES